MFIGIFMGFRGGLAAMLAAATLVSPSMNEGFADDSRKNIYQEVYHRFEGKQKVVKVQGYDCFITAEKGSLKLYLVIQNSKGEVTDMLFRDEGLDGSLEEHWIDGVSNKTRQQMDLAESFYRIIVEDINNLSEDDLK